MYGAYKNLTLKMFSETGTWFWAWAWLAKQRPKLLCQKIKSCQTMYGKERVKVRSAALPLRYKNRPVKITMYLGLDNIIRLSFSTNFNRCAILNVLNCLTKNYEP